MKKIVQVKVIERFKDKYTSEIYEVDRILNVTEERYEEIKKYVIKLFEERAKKSARRKG